MNNIDTPAFAEPAGLDLETVTQHQTAELILLHPVTKAPTTATITIAGEIHPARRAVVFARMRAARKSFEANGRVLVPDPSDDAADELEVLAACTVGWSNLVVSGVPLSFDSAAARALYADPRRLWLRQQVKAALDQSERFIRPQSI